MSNETIKLEADCSVATYNHLHHHHHNHHLHHPHQNPHLQHHHNPIPHHGLVHDHHTNIVPPLREEDEKKVDNENEEEDEENDDDNLIDGDDEQENKNQTTELLRLESFNRCQIDHQSIYKLSNSKNEQINGDKFTQLENVNPLEHQTTQKDVIRMHQSRQLTPASSSPSSSVDSSENSEDEELDSEEEEDGEDDDEKVDEDEADDEYAEDDDDDDGEDEVDDQDDDEEEDEDEDEDEDSDGIVDPVGHHHYLHSSGDINTNSTLMSDVGRTATTDDYHDVLFTNDESSTHSLSSSDLLYSERMLEVTRKLVRSTERDPDRDLRKQVLLRTAIKKLPHFMEYNHYSETFDQNFRLHNNTMNDNNNTTALECLSSSQYYDHHSIHHLEQQPKSYYHAVQPNAIQMSTTSLRMLDLNDDPETEFAATNPIEAKNHLMSYESTDHVAQTNLDLQHDYANSSLYNPYSQHSSPMNQIQDQSISLQNDQRTIMHDFDHYSNGNLPQPESTTNSITRHDTLDNLYHPIDATEINGSSESSIGLPSFQTVQDYSRICARPETFDQAELASSSDVEISGDIDRPLTVADTSHQHIIATDTKESEANTDQTDSQNKQRNDCNLHHTKATAHHDSNELTEKLDTHVCNTVSLCQNGSLDGNDSGLNEDRTSCSESGSSSSQSSTSSEDGANSSSSQSDDSAGYIDGLSTIETSHNASDDYFHRSHDSGIAFSPKANKRTSSSIGLDEEMEIDHNSLEMAPTDHINTGTAANHYKKLRKRELLD